MRQNYHRWLVGLAAALIALGFAGCSHDEENLVPPPASRQTINLTFENPAQIEVQGTRHWALLMHDRTSSSGPALQLVDLNEGRVLRTLILDYYDVYDIALLPGDAACFAGRPQGNIGYAVQFLSLPELTLDARVMTADTAGTHGYLAVDSAGGYVYYSHAGGGDRDGVCRISLATKMLSDADNASGAPFSFDNDLVGGLLNAPGRIGIDAATHTLVVANTSDDYITLIDLSLWGTVARTSAHTFPITGTRHLSTANGLGTVRAWAMCGRDGVFAFAGTAGNTAYLSRFGVESVGLDFVQAMPANRAWCYRNANLQMHPRQDVFSVFVMQRDTTRYGIGQYRLNNLQPVADTPLRTQVIADSAIAAVGVDVAADELVVADRTRARLEIIPLR